MHYALNYYGATEKSDRLFGERRSSEVNESPCKQICHDTGARDTELVTTTKRSDNLICPLRDRRGWHGVPGVAIHN